jgi:monoamine oxidase
MTKRHEVIVLEGQNRVGGRVLTVRDGFEAGGHTEMGATRIFSTHTATLRYVDLFNLGPLVPYDSGNSAFYIGGSRFAPPPAGQPWPIAEMSEAERANPYAFLGTYLGPGFEMLGDIDAAGWPNDQPTALELDELTVEQYLLKQGASQGWIEWFCALEAMSSGSTLLPALPPSDSWPALAARCRPVSLAATTGFPRRSPRRLATGSSSSARSCALSRARVT